MSVTPTVKRRKLGVEEIKLFIGTASVAVTLALWSVIASRDYLVNLQKSQVSVLAGQDWSSYINSLAPLPTLVPFDPNMTAAASQPQPASNQPLRSVSAPQQATTSKTPVRVRSNRSSSGTTTTRTRTS